MPQGGTGAPGPGGSGGYGAPGPGGSGGYGVDVPALRTYVGDLDNYRDQSGKITELVDRADVGNQSWGLVGLATKDSYTETLHALQDLLGAATKGLQTAADKVTDAADVYAGLEDDHATTFNDIQAYLDGPRQ